jgi:hypothetical protein
MPAAPDPQRPDAGLADELTSVLDGIDQHAPLDSLQSVAVMSFLRNRGLDVPSMPFAKRPRTVKEWVLWASRHSAAS